MTDETQPTSAYVLCPRCGKILTALIDSVNRKGTITCFHCDKTRIYLELGRAYPPEGIEPALRAAYEALHGGKKHDRRK